MTKRKITVKDKELIDRLNSRVMGVDTAQGEDKTVKQVIDRETGKVVAELPEERFTETPTDPPTEWVSDRSADIPNGEVVVDTTVKVNPLDKAHWAGAEDAEEWDKHDSIEEAKESRIAVSTKSIDRDVLNKANEDILYKKFMRNPKWLITLKRAIDDAVKNEETRMRTPSKEQVNHPTHYNDYDVEVIEMMERVFGHEAVINFCRLNAFKYRMRAGHKDGNSLEQDLKKERWYLDYIKEHDQAPLSPGAPVTEE